MGLGNDLCQGLAGLSELDSVFSLSVLVPDWMNSFRAIDGQFSLQHAIHPLLSHAPSLCLIDVEALLPENLVEHVSPPAQAKSEDPVAL